MKTGVANEGSWVGPRNKIMYFDHMHACLWLSQLATDARSCVKNERRQGGRKEGRKEGSREPEERKSVFKAQSTCVLGRKEGHWFLTPNQPLY